MIAQTPYQNMIYSQPQMAYTPQMYNPWTTRPQSQVQPMPVEQPQQVMQPQVKPLTGKVVQTLEAITANDVPMDGTAAFFPKQDLSEMRDLDRMSGRMHYTEPTTATRDSREGKSGMMRRSYIEAKEMHKDKDTTMQELEKYLKGVSEDITDVIGSMTPEERSMLKSKMSTLVTKL